MSHDCLASFLALAKAVRDFQDADLTYATRESDLVKKQSEVWHAFNDALVLVVPIVAAANPEAMQKVAQCAESLVTLTEQLYETGVFRHRNLLQFVAAIPEVARQLPKEDVGHGGN